MRHAQEVHEASRKGVLLQWFRNELQVRTIDESKLLVALATGDGDDSEDSMQSIPFKRFGPALSDLGLDCDIATYGKLWATVSTKDSLRVRTGLMLEKHFPLTSPTSTPKEAWGDGSEDMTDSISV